MNSTAGSSRTSLYRFALVGALAAALFAGCQTLDSRASTEPLSFAIYSLAGDARTLIAEGKLNYTLQDIDVVNWGNQVSHPTWKKSLKLKNGFSIGMQVIRADELPGLGLWIANDQHPMGFSWEWFVPESGDAFRKLQGEGHLRVIQSKQPDGIEVQSVEFLTDITLRFQEDVRMGPGMTTHEIVVSKGSVLHVAS